MLETRTATIETAINALRDADSLTARALAILGSLDIEATTCLSAEMLLVLGARRTGADARMTMNAAVTLRTMPETTFAFETGALSWAQVRAIVISVRSLDTAGRTRIDSLIATNADRLTQMDPDVLLAQVDDAVATLRPDLERAREDRRIENEYLHIQGHLDGSSTLMGEAGPESTASIVEALDAIAPRPTSPDGDGPTRPQQHIQALVAMAEHALNGGSATTTRPRPRLIATVDLDSLRDDADGEAARILWSVAGRPARITPLTTETLLCDATVSPVFFQGRGPVAVGDALSPISSTLRTALIARDGGCRFPGCGAPVSWCDAHHIRARILEPDGDRQPRLALPQVSPPYPSQTVEDLPAR